MDIRKICEDIAYGRTNRDEIYKFADNQIIYIDNYTTPRKPNNFIENLIPKRVKLDDK
jgi:hypothetical protein